MANTPAGNSGQASNPVYNWFDERLEIQSIADDISSKYVPPHVNIFYCLGGITLVCFLIQFATGFAMTFYYKPTVAEAYASVQYLMTDVSFGWLISGLIVIENVFNYPGLGRLLVFAIDRRDLPLLQAVTMVTVLGFALANLAADLLYAFLNPRIRLG